MRVIILEQRYWTREGRVLEIQECEIDKERLMRAFLCALYVQQQEKVHAENAKKKSRRDRRETIYQMSLRSLRANHFLPKLCV